MADPLPRIRLNILTENGQSYVFLEVNMELLEYIHLFLFFTDTVIEKNLPARAAEKWNAYEFLCTIKFHFSNYRNNQ